MAQKMEGRDKRDFGKILIDNICLGEDKERTLKTLDKIPEDRILMQQKNGSLSDSNEDTILHLTMMYQTDITVMETILRKWPDLILRGRKGPFEGQTVLHMAISNQNPHALRMLFKNSENYKDRMLRQQATGSRFMSTVMMGELPFSVAALTLDKEIIEIMFENGADKMARLRNSFGDTVFHSLIKYSCYHPSKGTQIIKICKFIDEGLVQKDPEERRAIWLLPNNNNQTPLQLSASLEQVDIFTFILNIENVYRTLDKQDGLFDVHLFDISEIDTVAIPMSSDQQRNSAKDFKVSRSIVPEMELSQDRINHHKSRYRNPDTPNTKPILETMCEISVDKAFKLLNTNTIATMISQKWNRYRYIYLLWAALHTIYMSVLTWNAVNKTELLADMISQGNESTPQEDNSTKTSFTLFMNILDIAVGLGIISTEIWRRLQGHKFHLKQLHHNGSYRVMLLMFAISLIVDSIWYLANPSNNFFLIAALLIGWWFLTFFLRAYKKFSFFTVMLQMVLVGDVLRFAVIILIEFLSFSIAMYMNFLYTKPEGFRTIGESFMTLFNLMLGLTELNVLEQARDPWLAHVLYILFVLVTYVIILNALIAMMSQTCANVSENKVVQARLQRLSVILFIEQILPNILKVRCGQEKSDKLLNMNIRELVDVKRSVLEISSLQAKSAAIINRHKMIRKTEPASFSDIIKTVRLVERSFRGPEQRPFDRPPAGLPTAPQIENIRV